MLTIGNNNKITLTRGDTAILKIAITDKEGEAYTPGVGDEIRFAMKKNYNDENVLVRANAIIDGGDITITILPEHTKSLPYGVYRYDIQLTTSDGIVDTFIDRAAIELTEEVD